MKVADVMQKYIFAVSEDTPIKEAGRRIFSLGVGGLPVLKGKKIVGIITEQDILSRLYPTIQELAQDYVHVRDFEGMEKNLKELLNSPVKEIMNRNVTSVTPDTPLMRAQSIMLVNNFSRLPIVNSRNEIMGIVSQGDIFRQILREEMPNLEKERYAGFIGRYYDEMVNWEKRFKFEFPTILPLLQKQNVSSVLDIGVWTGEYSVGLVKASKLRVTGLDHNPEMIRLAERKRKRASDELSRRLKFILSDFTNIKNDTQREFDALICMGNSLPYLPIPPYTLFVQAKKLLRKRHPIILLQLLNFEKILKKESRLLSFSIQKAEKGAPEKEHLFMEFFDRDDEKHLTHRVVIFDSDGQNWIYKGITSVPVHYITKEDVERALRRAGFLNISFSGNMGEYQGDYGKLTLDTPFNASESDWLNVLVTG